MAEFTVNPQRVDAYQSSKFRVKWDGKYVAGVDYVSRLARATSVVAHREGGELRRERLAPGVTGYAPLVLRRGRTHDTEFERWADKVSGFMAMPDNGEEMSLGDFRKDIVVELYNEAGQQVMAWKVYRCWPSEYVAINELDAAESAVATESLVLQNEGWERDASVTEPVEPRISPP